MSEVKLRTTAGNQYYLLTRLPPPHVTVLTTTTTTVEPSTILQAGAEEYFPVPPSNSHTRVRPRLGFGLGGGYRLTPHFPVAPLMPLHRWSQLAGPPRRTPGGTRSGGPAKGSVSPPVPGAPPRAAPRPHPQVTAGWFHPRPTCTHTWAGLRAMFNDACIRGQG